MGGSQLLDKTGPRASSIPTAKPYPPGPAPLPTPSTPPTQALPPRPCPLPLPPGPAPPLPAPWLCPPQSCPHLLSGQRRLDALKAGNWFVFSGPEEDKKMTRAGPGSFPRGAPALGHHPT